MAQVWRDSALPQITTPSDLKTQQFRLGSARYQLLPSQFEFLHAKEEALGYIGGFGSGKTRIGTIKASILSMFPNNRGIVGRLASTDLEDTTQRDLLDFLREAELLKEEPNARNKKAVVHCIDPRTGQNLGYTSEISFQHMDDPKHLRSRHIGWFWIDEASEVGKKAWTNLIGRLRWPAFRGRYQAFATGNPEGHNWVYDFFFNEELISKALCGHPGCTLSPIECNVIHVRKKRRGINAPTSQNYFLPPDYIEQMYSSYSPEEIQRYLEASFDAFEGQIFREFTHDVHVIHV